MKKFRIWIWGIVGLSLVGTIVIMIIAPGVVVMHFNGTGAADSWSGRAGLMLEPLIMLLIGLVCDRIALSQRKRSGLVPLPVVLVGEWRLIAFFGISAVVMGLLQLTQIGLM